MIKIEHVETYGWEAAIRGMRNPKNSWDRSDSVFGGFSDGGHGFRAANSAVTIGPNDHDLMMRLANGGAVHAKYRRMIVVYADVTAPLYWWKEYDTYKVGTVANSCSTMHKIAAKEFERGDFSCEHLTPLALSALGAVIDMLNHYRADFLITNGKNDWWQMIQLLPSSYNQKRTVMLNYEVLNNIYFSPRFNHKLDEWCDFCDWIKTLPYSEIILTPDAEEAIPKIGASNLARGNAKDDRE